MGSFRNYLENVWLEHVLKDTPYTKPSVLYLALSTADFTEDASGAAEPSASSYARAECLTAFGTAASNRSITNDGDITFPTAGASWGTIGYWAIYDASTAGNMLAYGAFTTGKAIGAGQTPKVLTGELVIAITSGGMSTYLANEMLDHTFLDDSASGGFAVPTNLYVGLGTNNFGDDDSNPFANEVADSGAYARVNVNSWTVAGNAAENTSVINFTTATGSWGTVSDHFIADSGTHGAGNLLFYGDFLKL